MPAKPGGATLWDNSEFLMELGIAFFQAAQSSGGLSQKMRDAIVDYLQKQGHNVTWEAIRAHPKSSSFYLPSLLSCLFFGFISPHPIPTTTAASSSTPISFSSEILAISSIYSLELIMTTPGRQTMRWDANVHEDILICLFQHLKLSTQDWASVMQDLHAMKYTFTESALRQHVQKLRRNRDTTGFEAAVGGTRSETSTPRKAATPRKRNTPAKKSKALISADADDEEDEKQNLKKEADSDDEQLSTPKRPAKRAKKTPKLEPESEHEDMDMEGEV
ncbi:hypothetical protein G7Z17_g11208 [Cylindrodendrum hubeiense]|uniref:Uncharacterized protein n=1 Tax=Cylindrodendrum hubeiense TaxID=595255 RepID=A0A9P5GXH4_9HYPO|nr:hypothetical protein G7Z17_g11208 [Cylindrodendrum hubeiense]